MYPAGQGSNVQFWPIPSSATFGVQTLRSSAVPQRNPSSGQSSYSSHSREQTALNEAWEEAGIRGQLVGEAIGTYEYAKFGTRLTVAVYVMRVVEELAVWPEMRLRHRKWVPLGEVPSVLARHPVRSFLDHVSDRLRTGAA